MVIVLVVKKKGRVKEANTHLSKTFFHIIPWTISPSSE